MKDVERKYASIKEAYEQTKTLSKQIKTKPKNISHGKETSERVIKALRRIIKTKIDSVPDKNCR